MSKFSDLIQKKNEMLKVTMKVDPAACKNGEITHFKEYVGFVLAEKEFEKTYEKLLKQYTLQNEGFFDSVGGALRAVGRRLKDDIVSPFKDAKYNPFVGHGDKPVDTTESGQIINEIKNQFLDVNKKVTFLIRNTAITKSYKQLSNEDNSIASFYGNFKKIFATKTENYKNSSFLNLISEASGAPPTSTTSTSATSATSGVSSYRIKSFLLKGISLTDINTQISVRNLKETFLPQIKTKIEEENNKRSEMRQEMFKSSANDVWTTLVQEVEKTFKPSRSKDALNQEKILWIFILAQPNQKVNLTYNPTKQISSGT